MSENFGGFEQLESSKKLSSRIADLISARIENGEVGVGEKLPPEINLAKGYRVSRAIIREAFAILNDRGLIESRHGIGATVLRRYPILQIVANAEKIDDDEFKPLFEIRSVLEGWAAYFAALRCTEKEISELELCFKKLDIEEDLHKKNMLDMEFHFIIWEMTRNKHLNKMMNALLPEIMRQINYAINHSYERAISEQAVKEHKDILEALSEACKAKKKSDKKELAENAKEIAMVHVKNAASRLDIKLD